MSLVEGQNVGPYRIIGQLGQGGMATVYQAYHAKLDRHVAIKVIHQAFQGDATFLARFEREAQIVAKLGHPHIVPVYDYNEHEGQPYLVMKFIEGRTLKNILSGGRLSLEQILDVMTPIAGALTYAHQRGVVHRDIKPSNIIIDRDQVPYLTDFGLARIAQAGESTMSQDMILGTPQYISPEQAKGEKILDARTAIYSLGVVLYELVVGRVPFNADTPYAIVHDHIYTQLPSPSALNPDIPPALENVLLKTLAKNPVDRYASAVEMIAAFRQASEGASLESFTSESAIEPSPQLNPPISVPSPAPPGTPRKVGVEHRFDTGDIGRRIEQGVKQGAEYLGGLAFTIQEAIQEKEASLPEEERIRRRVEKRFKERQGLIIHFVAYIMINLMLWAIWGASGSLSTFILSQDPEIPAEALQFPWPMFVTLGWGIGMISHIINYYSKYGPGAERRERVIQREIERERERSMAALEDKPKRDRRMRLTDDGELEEVTDTQSRKHKRR